MLTNLYAELARKGIKSPVKAVEIVLGCTNKTARNKMEGHTAFTVPEAMQVMDAYFDGCGFDFKYLFVLSDKSA